eukprot:CAMPEP_0114588678 /NCGR_PEP_ID=MMETSP0125-20121206/11323_1 /TAXON_ID=485358 ORGANISM="Aristerostoma sp., Strain ATCC 50986" /NCGR_SAMPLE_ID=MMETSP0125 /ASSEMBLY_ACC=CAM_ASM_000245 /LENGTH=202 /DNA_ID=CAMNT_0001785199 /DNA_START=35 /DNA_END=643 /DNA_ORIENTATION=+
MSAEEEVLAEIDEILEGAEDETQDINLDGVVIGTFTKNIAKKLSDISDLVSLSLNECEIESFENFPKLPNLQRLEIFSNKFKGADLAKLVPQIPAITTLLLGENEISEYSDVECFKSLKNLAQLELSGSTLSDKEDYREKIFGMFPELEVLDGEDKDGNPVEEDDEGIPLDDDEDDDEGEDDDYNEDDEDDEEDQKKKKLKK